MKAKRIMFLGTASSVGKSTVATAFCRYFKKKGYKVAPYKALNISLNSFITKDGDEIGRAQVVQAEACEIEPKECMNPILMKPSTNYKTQVIVRGKVHCTMDAYKYGDLNKYLKEKAKEAFEAMEEDYEIIVLEGSGSCAEINLRETDIANMYTAEITDSPVILVADIDKGGVFASIVGTIMLLKEEERQRVKGIIINKFRGKKEYFVSAMKQIEDIVNIPVLGVIPYFNLDIEEEDSATENIKNIRNGEIDIAVIRLPHMSNFTDFNSLKLLKGINVRYVDNPEDLNDTSMIIIPGSKNTIHDLRFIKNKGFKEGILKAKDNGTLILGICGGYQMLGESLKDPLGVESEIKEEEGLGLLEIVTEFDSVKTTRQAKGKDIFGNEISGYEIHNGKSIPTNENNIWIVGEDNEVLGMKNEESTVFGTYLHGLFDESDFCNSLVNSLYKKDANFLKNISYKEHKISQYNELSKILKENIDMLYVENNILNL